MCQYNKFRVNISAENFVNKIYLHFKILAVASDIYFHNKHSCDALHACKTSLCTGTARNNTRMMVLNAVLINSRK